MEVKEINKNNNVSHFWMIARGCHALSSASNFGNACGKLSFNPLFTSCGDR